MLFTSMRFVPAGLFSTAHTTTTQSKRLLSPIVLFSLSIFMFYQCNYPISPGRCIHLEAGFYFFARSKGQRNERTNERSMVSRDSINERLRQSSFDRNENDGWKGSTLKSMQSTEHDITGRPKQKICAKKRIRDDAPVTVVVEPKKTCLLDHGEHDVRQSSTSTARLRQYREWTQVFQHRNVSVIEMVAASGSIDELLHLTEYLFQSNRVETFTLDMIVDFWAIFPEAAKTLLKLFKRHECWQHLLLLMERARFTGVTGKQIWTASFELLKDQWDADLKALTGENGHKLSEMAMGLPRSRKESDYRLDFVRRFARIVYPRVSLPSEARERYRRQCLALREAIKANRRGPSSTTRSRDHRSSTAFLANERNRQIKTFPRKSGQERGNIPSFQHTPLYESLLSFSPPGGGEVTRGLLLPIEGRVDHFLHLQRIFRTSSEIFLRKPVLFFDHSSSERILYIHQGEVGYALPSQCDIILSDRATTCHILSIQSISSGQSPTLFSLAHIDGSLYSECLMEMIEIHVRHHQLGEEREEENAVFQKRGKAKLELVIDIVGGFDDDRGASAQISSWLLEALAYLAEDHQDILNMNIRTCAISYLNGDGNLGPIGRGMGVDLRSGEAFLAQADSSVVGPSSQLRSARIWSGGGNGRLAVVHKATCNDFIIHPFEYAVFDKLHDYLRMPDSKMIRRTSTSPDVEEPDFCSNVRNTLRFIKGVDCRRVFGPDLDQAIIFRRVESSNVWKRHSGYNKGDDESKSTLCTHY